MVSKIFKKAEIKRKDFEQWFVEEALNAGWEEIGTNRETEGYVFKSKGSNNNRNYIINFCPGFKSTQYSTITSPLNSSEGNRTFFIGLSQDYIPGSSYGETGTFIRQYPYWQDDYHGGRCQISFPGGITLDSTIEIYYSFDLDSLTYVMFFSTIDYASIFIACALDESYTKNLSNEYDFVMQYPRYPAEGHNYWLVMQGAPSNVGFSTETNFPYRDYNKGTFRTIWDRSGYYTQITPDLKVFASELGVISSNTPSSNVSSSNNIKGKINRVLALHNNIYTYISHRDILTIGDEEYLVFNTYVSSHVAGKFCLIRIK